MIKGIKIIRAIFSISIMSCLGMFLTALPNQGPFPRLRVWYWRNRGFAFSNKCFLARNVYFQGRVSIDDGSSISDNCSFNGCLAGIFIGKKVMLGPNCVIVAFSHGMKDLNVPMIDQPLEEAPIFIDDDVWISANCTITKGVHLGKGCIIGANSVVTNNVEPYSIVGGVPAKVIGSRLMKNKGC